MRICGILFLALLLVGCGKKGPQPISFRNQVQPILDSRCVKCHNGERGPRKIVLTSYDNLMNSRTKSGKNPLVVPGNPSDSWLYILSGTDQPHYRMPPDTSTVTALPKAELDILGRWIMQGAQNN